MVVNDQETYSLAEQHRPYLFNGEMLCAGCSAETKAPCLVARLVNQLEIIQTEVGFIAQGYHYDEIEHHCDCGQSVAQDLLLQLE